MYSSNIKKERLYRFLELFLSFRRSASSGLNSYVERLKSYLLASETVSAGSSGVNKYPPVFDRTRNISISFSDALAFLRLLPAFWNQKKQIVKIRREFPDSPIAVVATSGIRLFKEDSPTGVKRQIEKAARGLNKSDNTKLISDLIRDSEIVFLFDTEKISRARSISGLFEKEKVIVVDVYFIYFLSILAPSTTFKNIAHLIGQRFRRGKEESVDKILPAAHFFNEIYWRLLGDLTNIQGILFTCNSFNIEILRYFLITSEGCKVLYEIMHGIPSKHVQEYFSKIVDFDKGVSAPPKVRFITQIPTIQSLVLPGNNEAVAKELSINTYYNEYFDRQLDSDVPVSTEDFIESKLNSCFDGNYREFNDKFLFFFVGGSSRLVNSEVFGLELKLLDSIKKAFQSMDRDFVIVYSPHPHHVPGISKDPVFDNRGVVFFNDTTFSLLIAEGCAGLFSSTLYEAGYLSIPTYIPMVEEDDLYPGNLLNLLSKPARTDGRYGDLSADFTKFVTSLESVERSDVVDRAKKRIALLRSNEVI